MRIIFRRFPPSGFVKPDLFLMRVLFVQNYTEKAAVNC